MIERKFPTDCTRKCPHMEAFQSSMVDVHYYCRLLGVCCDAERSVSYNCPLKRGSK